VILGSGQPGYERAFCALAEHHPGRVAARIAFDEGLAHRYSPAPTRFIVPSRFEPCGLTHCMACATVRCPVVRRIGGLADTVTDEGQGDAATGFVFDAASSAALRRGTQARLAVYADRTRWQQLMRNGMTRPVSWLEPARAYRDLYQQLLDAD